MNKKQSWRVTGLWAKDLPQGGQVLSAKVNVQAIVDVLQQVQDAGLHDVQVEVWAALDAGEPRRPTHNLRFVEPFQGSGQAKPRQAEGESYPF